MGIREHEFDYESINVHCWEGEAGFPILMMHGSGPGVSTVGNWRQVLEPLGERYHVLAFDLIGFGLSGRKKNQPYFDLDLWLRQAQAMLDRLPEGPIGIIAHSISAALALRLAAANDRVTKVLTTGAMGASFELNSYLEMAWTVPKTREELRQAFEPLIYDKSAITDAFLDNRMEMLQTDDYGPYFAAMFKGDKQGYIDTVALSEAELAKVECDVVMMHGRDDLAIPFEVSTLVLSSLLPQADVVLIARCGHGVAQEQPGKFIATAEAFFG